VRTNNSCKAAAEIWPAHSSGISTTGQGSKTVKTNDRGTRNIFSGVSIFFPLPIDLYTTGAVRSLKPSAVIRYMTFCRLANYHNGGEVRYTLRQLEELDGVSPRAARLAHCKLLEYGLIHCTSSKPKRYIVEISAECWAVDCFRRPFLPNRPGLTVEQ
jgi:hypothetical protein